MHKRLLGRSGLEVSRIGLGCVTFGREINEEDSFRIMDYALERGITLFDTAEAYGGGEARDYRRKVLGVDDVREVSAEAHSSEKIIGRWLRTRGVRDQIVLQTKITTQLTASHIAQAVADSLERLQTETIDIYMFHSFDPETPLDESLTAMTEAVRRGKVRTIGCSNFTADQLRSALEVSPRLGLQRLEEIQPNYSLVARDIEQDMLPLCRKEQVAAVTYSPLGAGFLSGKYTADRNAFPKGSRFHVIPAHADVYFSERNFRVVEQLRKKSEATGVPMVRLAMAWVLRNPDVTSALVGARTTAHLDNALMAMEMDFPQEWMAEMNGWN
jgi:aryl-alcohol dehydrogenase-like predicted oxidoreductase